MTTLIPKFDLKDGGSTPTGAINRAINLKLADTVSVKDFGAVGNGTTDDTAAIQAAINNGGTIIIPAGTYKVTNSINIPIQVSVIGEGLPIITGYTANSVFIFQGMPAAGGGIKNYISGIYFTNGATFTPNAFIQVGKSSATNVEFAAVNVEINECNFLGNVTYAVAIYKGYNTNIRSCQFTFVTGTCLKTFQSNVDNPTWAYAISLFSTDFSNITGQAINANSGDIEVFGGVIEGCSLGAVEISSIAGLLNTVKASFHGVYFEGNTLYNVKSTNNSCTVGFFGCQFKSAGINNSFVFQSGSSVNFYNCTSPNNSPTFTGGNIRLLNCAYMYQSSTSVVESIRIDQYPVRTNDPVTANNLLKQINVNSTEGGGAAILLCTHESGSGNATNAELFLVRYGRSGNNYSVKSISREEGTDTAAYTFSIDANGYLQVASTAGKTRYMVISNTAGEFLPAGG